MLKTEVSVTFVQVREHGGCDQTSNVRSRLRFLVDVLQLTQMVVIVLVPDEVEVQTPLVMEALLVHFNLLL